MFQSKALKESGFMVTYANFLIAMAVVHCLECIMFHFRNYSVDLDKGFQQSDIAKQSIKVLLLSASLATGF